MGLATVQGLGCATAYGGSAAATARGGANAASAAPERTVYFRIKGVRLTPDDPHARVHLRATLNGQTYEYPSTPGVMWTLVGPEMTQTTVPIHSTDNLFNVSFAMTTEIGGGFQGDDRALSTGQYRSTDVRTVIHLPYSEEYKLYRVTQDIKEAAVSAIVSYSLSDTP